MRTLRLVVLSVLFFTLVASASAGDKQEETKSKGEQAVEQILETRKQVKENQRALTQKAVEIVRMIHEERQAQEEAKSENQN